VGLLWTVWSMLWQKYMMFWPSDSRGMRLQDGTVWLLAWQEQRHGDAYIWGVVVHMTKKTCRDVCKYMIHTVIEGLDHRSGESLGTRMPTGLSAAAVQKGQRAQDRNIFFHIWSYSHETLHRNVRGWYLHCGQRVWYLGSRFAGECQNKLVLRNC
jgi:hypothetical protein